MKINKNKKGFTLTELIIVIVIIGILAAVLIPSLSSYIKKAKVSKGEQEAREMNTILAAEAIYQDREYFDAYEISKLLKEANFELKSKLPDYRFWYDASVNQVKYLSMSEAFEGTSAAEKTFTQDCIEALSSAHPQYRYVDTYDDELTNIISTVRNLVDLGLGNLKSSDIIEDSAAKNTVINNMENALRTSIEKINNLKIKGLKKTESEVVRNAVINYASTFNTYDTVYVDDNLMYNRVYFAKNSEELSNLRSENISINGDSLSLTVSHMVFTGEITKIPASYREIDKVSIDVIITNPITIPDTVTTITNNAFTNVSFCPSIIVKDTIVVDNEAFSEVAKNAVRERNSNVSFVTLYLGDDFVVEYKAAEAKLNDGNLLNVEIVTDESGNYTKLNNVTFLTDDSSVISKYLIPSIKFINPDKIDFTKIDRCIIRRSILENICTYTGILIDKDLNCYKVDSFGYVTDIDWDIEQDFIRNVNGQTEFGSESATIKVYLPSYVYNFTNYNGASIEVVVKPQVIKSREAETIDGKVDVFNGIELSDKPITFYIKDGVYDASTKKYVYTYTIDKLSEIPLGTVSSTDTCNQITIDKISIYTGIVVKDDSGNYNTDNINYLFIRYYK